MGTILKRIGTHRRIAHRIKRLVATFDVLQFPRRAAQANGRMLTAFNTRFFNQTWNLL